MGDAFGNILTNLTENVSNQQQREKMEDYAVMIASIAVAEEVPGLGEVQMALQFLDFIDPYGYNQALNRDQLNQMLTSQYQKIQDMQTNITNCYQNQDMTACGKAGITSDDLQTYQSYSPEIQAKLLKVSTSWANPIDPIVKFPDALRCTIATSPEFMASCQNSQYKDFYMQYWNQNVAAFEANAAAAAEAASQGIANGLNGDTSQDAENTRVKKLIQVVLFVIGVVLVLAFYKIISRKK